MKLYNSIGPNPKMVRMFMHEKGIQTDTVDIDIMAAANREADYGEVNPSGTCPALELDDGSIISEITAICEYLEDIQPAPALIGSSAAERAETRMWARRVDLGVCEPMGNGFRFSEGLQLFENRVRCIPQAAADLKATAQDKLAWLDAQMAGKDFLAGERFTMADILLYSFTDFFAQFGQVIPAELENLTAWSARVAARPSAEA